jgi:hypothetical protein
MIPVGISHALERFYLGISLFNNHPFFAAGLSDFPSHLRRYYSMDDAFHEEGIIESAI